MNELEHIVPLLYAYSIQMDHVIDHGMFFRKSTFVRYDGLDTFSTNGFGEILCVSIQIVSWLSLFGTSFIWHDLDYMVL